jgi:hypothetical protein
MDEGLSQDNILDDEGMDALFGKLPDELRNGTEEKTVEDKPNENGVKTKEQPEVDSAITDNDTKIVPDSSVQEEPLENEDPDKDTSDEDETDDDTDDEEDETDEKDDAKDGSVFQSLSKALMDSGILTGVSEDDIKNVKGSDDFLYNVINKEVNSRVDDTTKRVYAAMTAGVEVPEIQKYERTIQTLSSITDDAITNEGQEGENLRKQLIYSDYINRGFSKEKATKEVQKSFSSGSDIDDAKDALRGNLDFFNAQYHGMIEASQKQQAAYAEERKKQAIQLKDSILNDKDFFGSFEVDKPTRKKVYDTIMKPVYKDEETGAVLTEMQKYEKDDRLAFLKNLGLCYTLTNGFKDFGGLLKGQVKKEMNKSMRELEHKLQNTRGFQDGSLRLVGGVSDDPEAVIGKGWDLDV